MDNRIKVGLCVSYDWYFLKSSLPLIYRDADSICLSVDKDRISWTQNQYTFDEERFREFISTIDVDKKITLYEDDFHHAELTPMENETRQRNKMADFMGRGGWHIQLDCDEYFIDFEKFVTYLKKFIHVRRPVNINCSFITLFKQTRSGFFYINPVTKKNLEFIQVATQTPVYTYGRRNGYFNICTNFIMVHQSWARTESEVLQKLDNWGHRNDFQTEIFFKNWEKLSLDNYKSFRNFHPILPELWPQLGFSEGKGITEFIGNFKMENHVTLSRFDSFLKNSRVLSSLRAIFIQ